MASRCIRLLSAVIISSCLVPIAAAQSQLWISQFGSASMERPFGAAEDGNGGVFVGGPTTGSLAGPAQDVDAWLAHADGNGNPLWVIQFGTLGIDGLWSTASDGAGGVLSAGYTDSALFGSNAGSYDAWLARHDAAGQLTWSAQLGSADIDNAWAVTSDGAGGAFLGGRTAGSFGGPNAGDYDAWVARSDNAGTILWVRQLGTPGWDEVNGAASDGAGGVYVCGETWGNLAGPNAGYLDAWLARYDASGALSWSRQLGTGQFDNAHAVTPDGRDGVFVAGATVGTLGGPNLGNYDIWVARYDGAGTQQWITQFGSASNDAANSVLLDGCGGVFVCGQAGPDLTTFVGPDAVTARVDGSGTLLWFQTLGTTEHDIAWATASDGAGGIFVAGETSGSLGSANLGSVDIWIAHYGSCNTGTSYCTASSTSIPGCQSAITAFGLPSLANPNGYTISSGHVPGGKFGLCVFGNNGPASAPFGTLGGQMCIQGPIFRSSVGYSGGSQGTCDGNFNFTLQDLIDAAPIVLPGAEIHAQILARDSNPDGLMLSEGLRFIVEP